MNSTPYCQNIAFLDDTLKLLPLQVKNTTATLHFEAAPGLYQFTAVADGSTFDWESLYINLELFGNTDQRTGPWNFDLTDGNRALTPSFWVELDGKRLGLWYFQRVSLADIAAKKFRGDMAFYLATSGMHELRFFPIRKIRCRGVWRVWKRDPQDQLLLTGQTH